MVERRVGETLACDLLGIVGEPPVGDGGRVDHRDHPVDGQPGAKLRPFERLDQRLGQREARGLDDDVLGLGVAREQRCDRRGEVVRDGAADAAVGQLDDILLRTGGRSA